MANEFGYLGAAGPTDNGSDYNANTFLVWSILARVRTMQPCQVTAVTGGGVGAVGFVTLQPLVNQLDGYGNATPHGQIYNVPYFRLQGGANAVILDPQVGDIGIAGFCDRDISSVKANKGQANPGSKRQFSMADAVYMGGTLNGTPGQYLQFSSTGVAIKANASFSASATGTASISATASATVSSSGQASLSGGALASVRAAMVTLGVGSAGNLNQLPAPQSALWSSFQSSGASALLNNPVASSISAATSSVSSVVSSLPNLVATNVITQLDATNITAALTGSGGLSSTLSAFQSHTDLLSGISLPTANVPSLSSLAGMAGSLDTFTGGTFGSASSLIPTMTTALTGGPIAVGGATSFLNGVVSGLTNGTLTPSSVISQVTSHASSITGIQVSDISSYTNVQADINKASSFLGTVGISQNTNPAISSLMGQVTNPATLATMKSIVLS